MADRIDELWEQICAESQRYYERVREPATKLAASIAKLEPDHPRVVEWLKERVWSEREGSKTKAYAVVKMAEQLQPVFVRELAQQSMSEASHFTYLEPCLRARGGSLAGYEPTPRWRRIFDKEYEVADSLDPVLLYATIHMGGEGPASATAEVYSQAYLGTRNEDISKAYQKIAVEETGHWDTGRTALRTYLKTPKDAERALEALRSMGDVLFGEYRHEAES